MHCRALSAATEIYAGAQLCDIKTGDDSSYGLTHESRPQSQDSSTPFSSAGSSEIEAPSSTSTEDMLSPKGSFYEPTPISVSLPPQVFTLFPQLPVELRLGIWALAILPRVLGFNILGTLAAAPYNPPLLHTCRESREVALSAYRPVRTSVFDDRRMIFFNLSLDTLLCYTHGCEGPDPDNAPKDVTLSNPRLDLDFLPPVAFKVKTLALDLQAWEELDSEPSPFSLRDLIRESKELVKVVLIWSHEDPNCPIDQVQQKRPNHRREILVIEDEGSNYNIDYFASIEQKLQEWRTTLKSSAGENEGWNEPKLTYGHVEWRKCWR